MGLWKTVAIVGGAIAGGCALAAIFEGTAGAAPLKKDRVKVLGGRTLKQPIEYTYEEKFPGYVFYCGEFDLTASGATFLDALQELTTALTRMWSDYGYTPDDQLGPSAVKAKARLRYLMGEK